jgi:hypothetical protein
MTLLFIRIPQRPPRQPSPRKVAIEKRSIQARQVLEHLNKVQATYRLERRTFL